MGGWEQGICHFEIVTYRLGRKSQADAYRFRFNGSRCDVRRLLARTPLQVVPGGIRRWDSSYIPYSALVEAYPITVIEALWTVVAIKRFTTRHRHGDANATLTADD